MNEFFAVKSLISAPRMYGPPGFNHHVKTPPETCKITVAITHSKEAFWSPPSHANSPRDLLWVAFTEAAHQMRRPAKSRGKTANPSIGLLHQGPSRRAPAHGMGHVVSSRLPTQMVILAHIGNGDPSSSHAILRPHDVRFASVIRIAACILATSSRLYPQPSI